MNIFLDISHPSYYLLFKNTISTLHAKGHSFLISTRDKDVLLALIHEDIPGHTDNRIQIYYRGKGARSWFGKGIGLLQTVARLYFRVKPFNPDLCISMSSPYLALCGRLLHKPVITFEDTECSAFLHPITKLFSSCIITGTSFNYDFGPKQIRLPFYKELAYLHPNVFKPNPAVPEKYGIKPGEPFVLIRLVGNHTIHEMGRKGLDDEFILECIRNFTKFCRVFISSEHPLSHTLKTHELSQAVLPPFEHNASDIHHLEYNAALLFGESATMAAEAAVLGTPAIYVDNRTRGYCEELEHTYGLMYHFGEEVEQKDKSLKKVLEILSDNHIKLQFRIKQAKMLQDKIELTQWIIEFIENFDKRRPESTEQLKALISKSSS